MWWWMYDGGGQWGWMVLLGWAWMLLFWGAIIALVVWVVRRLSQPSVSGPAPGRPTPLDIAKERYAKGEITRQEFEELKRDLA